MKRSIKMVILLSLCYSFTAGQVLPGRMDIQIKDLLTGLPISSKSFTVTLNKADSVVLVSDTDGRAVTKDLKTGQYQVGVNCESYLSYNFDNIVIGEGKTAYLVCRLIPSRPLTKKERRKAGFK